MKSVNGTQKHKGGRPSKRTSDREELLLKAIGKGIPYKAACKISGLGFTTFNDWRDTDSSFALKLEMAEGLAIDRNVAMIQKAASKDWKAAAWLLERRHPEMFGRPEVQLSQRVATKTQDDNLLIWTKQHAALPEPKNKDDWSISIEDLDIVCEAETDMVEI